MCVCVCDRQSEDIYTMVAGVRDASCGAPVDLSVCVCVCVTNIPYELCCHQFTTHRTYTLMPMKHFITTPTANGSGTVLLDWPVNTRDLDLVGSDCIQNMDVPLRRPYKSFINI